MREVSAFQERNVWTAILMLRDEEADLIVCVVNESEPSLMVSRAIRSEGLLRR